MATNPYTVRWLRPGDARAIAALEAKVHAREHHAGEQHIWAQLQETEQDGRNLSLGLYLGTRLVGFGLGYVMRDRREMAEFFDAPLPPELDPNGRTIYVADYVVLPKHRQASRLISAKFASIVRTRDDLRDLPIDGFSTAEYAAKWRERSKFIGKLGWRAAGCFPFTDTKLGVTLHWLHFERISGDAHRVDASSYRLELKLLKTKRINEITVGQLPSIDAWDSLRPVWDELLDCSHGTSPFHTWEYLRTWHVHFGLIDDPMIVVALRGEKPVAVLPLQAKLKPSWGRFARYFTFPTETHHLQPFSILSKDATAAQAIWDYLAAGDVQWDSLELSTFSEQSYMSALKERLRRAGHPTFTQLGATSHRIEIHGSWMDFLNTRPISLCQALTASESQLAQQGPLRLQVLRVADAPTALSQYLSLEQLAPDDETDLGTSVTAQQISLYRELARYAEYLGMLVGFFFIGEKPIAGAIGYLRGGKLHLIHLTRSADYAAMDAGLAAMGHIVKHCFTHDLCTAISFPDLRYLRSPEWATSDSPSTILRTEHAGLLGRLKYTANLFRHRKSIAACRSISSTAKRNGSLSAAANGHTP